MPLMHPDSSTPPRRPIVTGLWLIASVLLAFQFALNLQQNGKTFLDANLYTHFVEKRPYQYRALMAPVMAGLIQAFSTPSAHRVLAKLPVYVSTSTAAAYVAINAVSFAASCLIIVAIARKVLGPGRDAVAVTVAIYIGMAYFFFCLNPNVAFILPYDVPALALSQACLLCVLTRRWRWLYPLFLLATLNRETSFLIVVFMAAVAFGGGGPDRRDAVRHITLLCGLWLLVKALLYYRFSGLPSDEGLRLTYNLHSLIKPWQWPALFPLLASLTLSAWSLRDVPAETRAWGLTGIIGFLLLFVVGTMTETRAFADLLVFFSMAIGIWLNQRRTSDNV